MVRFTRMKSLVQYGKFPFRLFALTIILRCVDLLWVQSSFVPDEYWQSLEVAHNKAFGYGYKTWEWGKGIRNYFYVSIIYLLYKALSFLQIDTPELVILLPRILQGILSALADVYFIRWVHEKRSGQFAWGLISWVTTYFVAYCSTRTLINSFEMDLSIIALYYYPWTPKSTSVPFVALLSLLCFVRPTSVILWLPLVFLNIMNAKQPLSLILKSYLPIATIIIGLNVALDSFFSDSLIFTPYNFFKVNILEGVNSFYGSHDFLWYLYAGLPAVIGLQTIPFYVRTVVRITKSNFLSSLKYDLEAQMIFTVLWTIAILSLVPHKEFRFLLPLVPMAIFVSSGALGKWSTKASTALLYAVGALLIVTHSGALIFLGRFHNVGSLDTMTALRNDLDNSTSAKILFLAPCHSFPLYSHLHRKVPARFLKCTPNLKNESDYVDETERFYQNPVGWLRLEYATLQPCTLPTHIIKYDSLNITNFLYINNFTLQSHIFNSFYFPNRTGEFIQIYKRKGKIC